MPFCAGLAASLLDPNKQHRYTPTDRSQQTQTKNPPPLERQREPAEPPEDKGTANAMAQKVIGRNFNQLFPFPGWLFALKRDCQGEGIAIVIIILKKLACSKIYYFLDFDILLNIRIFLHTIPLEKSIQSTEKMNS